jgi:hypothetical protein
MCPRCYNNVTISQAPVAHAYNPSYSGGRDQEDRASKSAEANRSGDLTLKIPNTKAGLAEWLKCLSSKCEALSSNPSTEKKKNIYIYIIL